MLVLNSIFVASQFVGTIFSKSLSLLLDSILMAIDTVTYAASYYANEKGDARTTAMISKFNMATLLLTAVIGLVQGIWSIAHGDEHVVNSTVMIAFVSADAIIDIIFAIVFYLARRHLASDVNMQTVFGHTAADFLRTAAELISVLVILVWKIDPGTVDLFCAVTMSGLVALYGTPLLSVFSSSSSSSSSLVDSQSLTMSAI